MAADTSEFVTLLNKYHGCKRKEHLVKVYHIRKQNAMGGALIDGFMESNCAFKTVDLDKCNAVVDPAIIYGCAFPLVLTQVSPSAPFMSLWALVDA